MEIKYPFTIDNGGGEILTFTGTKYVDGKEVLEVENEIKPGSGPPMHIHWQQDESLTITQGKLGAQIAGKAKTYHGVGETVIFERGVAHKFWNAGEEVLICKGWVSPPNNLVYFLSQMYTSTSLNGGERPSIFDGAYLQMRYEKEFDLVEIPAFVKKTAFPIVVAIGKLLGKYTKFADAPKPTT